MSTTQHEYDCVVVGSGHAGSCAALALADAGVRRILIIDKCPEEWMGGNGYFTAGAHRTVHNGLEDLLPIVQNVSEDMKASIDISPYTAGEFYADIMRLGEGKPDKDLVNTVVHNSWDAIKWLAERAEVHFTLAFNRQAYLVDGIQKFWGGMALSVQDGGKGLIAAHRRTLQRAGVETWFDTAATKLLLEEGAICGLLVQKEGALVQIVSSAVILASGGYEANPQLRREHLGIHWEKAKASIGAAVAGDFSDGGCHSTCWDANAPSDRGDRVLSNQFTKSGYPLGLMVNAKGHRFVDEGEDFRNYTYARFGRAILRQPGGYAFQVWDSRVMPWLREEEYADHVVRKIWADTLEELASKLQSEGLDDSNDFINTIREYNNAVGAYQAEFPSKAWDPAVKDGLSTQSSSLSLQLPKSNWALSVDQPPFFAVKVACGITFTFGGLAVHPQTAQVLSKETKQPIEGLFCCGELVGGLFYSNYPGGSGLTAGAVLGRKAGAGAAERVTQNSSR
ncbi:hypothetical protein NM688_g2891 [Phlebia brevispora]|uniref:Uncharacterized protein n=1 Tax=Phlebia brevispora TaxID=194682 RepID=A0ACC1T782_9APHY|nr:hypothetical protein NM688_g2891 [Phlebia brevispora]